MLGNGKRKIMKQKWKTSKIILFLVIILGNIRKKVRKNERVLNCYLKCWKKSEINDVIYGIL